MSVASDRLAQYLAAEQKILLGQEVRMDTGGGNHRWWKGADLAEVRAQITLLQRQVAAETAATSGQQTIGGLGFARARFDRSSS